MDEEVKIKLEKSEKFGKGMTVLTVILAVYVLLFTVCLGWWYFSSKAYENSIARDFQTSDDVLFYIDESFNDRTSVNKFTDNIVVFNIFAVPESHKDATIEGLLYLEEKLQIFDIQIMEEDGAEGISIGPMTEEFFEETKGELNEETQMVGVCRFGKKDYDHIEHKYHMANTEIMLNFEVFDKYMKTSSKPFEQYKSTLVHEALHGIFFAKDIDSHHPYYETAESIMSYHSKNRTMEISDFDMKYIIEPQIINTLLRNLELVEYLNYDYDKIVEYAENMEQEYLKTHQGVDEHA